MKRTLKLASVLIPVVFVVAVLSFVSEALLPLILPLLLVAVVGVVWHFRKSSREPWE
jgi:hypothetical protein